MCSNNSKAEMVQGGLGPWPSVFETPAMSPNMKHWELGYGIFSQLALQEKKYHP